MTRRWHSGHQQSEFGEGLEVFVKFHGQTPTSTLFLARDVFEGAFGRE